MARGKGGTFADEGAEFGHLGQHHGHDFQTIYAVAGKHAGDFGLHHQHAEGFAQALDGDAEERGKDFLAGFGHEAKTLFGRGVGGVYWGAGARHPAHQPFADAQAGLVDSLFVQAFGGAQLQGFGVAEQVDRADVGLGGVGDQVGDAVKAGLAGAVFSERVAQAAQQLAGLAFGLVGYCGVGRGSFGHGGIRSGALSGCKWNWVAES